MAFAASDGYLPRRLPDLSPPTTSAAATEAATGTTPMQPPMQAKQVARCRIDGMRLCERTEQGIHHKTYLDARP